ncbi:CAPAR protein, partial [Acromyrmex heyeri]
MGTSSQDGDIENDTLDFWRDWDLSELTEDEYLSKVLGPKYLTLKLVIPLTITYVVIFITGIFGNVATCTVIVRNSSMQTATNYYLFSLAISDLTLLLLGLPNELSVFWQQYPWVLGTGLCKIRAYVSEMSSYVSVLTIVAFSMERHTIAQVKDIFCFTSNRQENIKDSSRNNGNASNFPQNAYSLQKEDSSSTFLFERGHLLAHQQPSIGSTTSTKRSEESVSV